MKKKFKMIISMLLLCAAWIFTLSLDSHALNPFASEEVAQNIKKLDGKYGFIKNYNNYYLDSQKTGLLDTGSNILNSIANTALASTKAAVLVASYVFYFALDFNIADMFGTQLNSLSGAMKSSVFEPLFLIGFAGSAIIIIKRLLKRDLMGSYGQIMKVLILFILSVLLTRESANVLSAATQITNSIGANILTGGTSSTESYAAKSSGQIWYSLMHIPWEYLEFGADPHTAEDVSTILMLPPSDPDRKTLVDNWAGSAFENGSRPGERVGFLLFYSLPLFAKCLLYIILGGILLIMQLLAVFYLLMAPLVLILAMIPGYDHILSAWIRKLLESQLSILVMYLVVGLLLRVDELLYNTDIINNWGWLVILIIQMVLYIGVIVKRNELFGMFSSIGVSNPIKYMNGEINRVNDVKNAVVRTASHAIYHATDKSADKEYSDNRAGTSVAVRRKDAAVAPPENNTRKEVERPRMAAFSEREAVFTYDYGEGAEKGQIEASRPSTATFRERQVIFSYDDRTEREPAQEIERPRMDAMYDMEPAQFREYKEKEKDNTYQKERQEERYRKIKEKIER